MRSALKALKRQKGMNIIVSVQQNVFTAFIILEKWYLVYFDLDKSVSIVQTKHILEVEEVPGGECTVKEKGKIFAGWIVSYGMQLIRKPR